MAQPESKHDRRGFGVAASPLNAVKLELVLILLIGLVLVVTLIGVRLGTVAETAVLGLYGVAGASWVVWRTRRVLRRGDGR